MSINEVRVLYQVSTQVLKKVYLKVAMNPVRSRILYLSAIIKLRTFENRAEHFVFLGPKDFKDTLDVDI